MDPDLHLDLFLINRWAITTIVELLRGSQVEPIR